MIRRLLWVVVVVGCKSAALNGETTRAPEPALASPIVATTVTNAAALAVRPEWKVAVAEQRWREAAALFDAVHEHPSEPSLRYVRARIAAENGEHERVIDLLNGLESQLSEFAVEIESMRAVAMAEVGPFDAAAQYFEKRADGEGRLLAARAWLKAAQPARALDVLEKSRSWFTGAAPSSEAQWRSLHAEVVVALGRAGQAVEDNLWLALRVPTLTVSELAVRQLESGEPRRMLTKAERYQRLEALARAGQLKSALSEEQAIWLAPGPLPSRVGVKRHLAWAHYQSREDYLKAAALFDECARVDSEQRASDLFYSARALSRAHRDELAIERYEELIRKVPGSKFAVSARQMIGRLWFALGRWAKAVEAYDGYLQKFGNSKHHRAAIGQARHERAIALLALADKRAVGAIQGLLQGSESANHQALLTELLGVAYAQTGEIEQARRSFEEVISTRPLSFAALVAAARLRQMGLPVPVELAPSLPEDSDTPSPLQVTLPGRVRQLIELGLDGDAESELATTNGAVFDRYAPRAGEAACTTFGQLATAKERYRRGLKVVRERVIQRVMTAGTRWMWECLYPTPYQTAVGQSAATHGVEPSMIYAVMRQESGFHPTVESPAAACGLMQIIEPTGRSLAADLDVAFSRASLLTPSYNVNLGAAYLAKLLRRFDGHLALAAGAYNAGPAALARWLQTGQDLPLDVFVGRIIYEETRTYVQRVLANWARYRYLEGGLGNVPQLSLDLPAYKALAPGEY